MIYGYLCHPCRKSTDVVKPASEFDRVENCPVCKAPMQREFAPRKIYFSGTAVQEKKWQPAIGEACTDREMRRIAKERGMIELGNERPEKHLTIPETEYPTFTAEDLRSSSFMENLNSGKL